MVINLCPRLYTFDYGQKYNIPVWEKKHCPNKHRHIIKSMYIRRSSRPFLMTVQYTVFCRKCNVTTITYYNTKIMSKAWIFPLKIFFLPAPGGMRWHSWLRHCATNRQVAGSVPNGVTGIFYWHNPSGSTMVLGLNQPLKKNEYQEYFLGGKGGQWVGLTLLSCTDCLEKWEPQPPGNLRTCRGL